MPIAVKMLPSAEVKPIDAGEAGLTYGILSQPNPAYDAALFEELQDLYEGGYRIMRKATKYCPQLVSEVQERYMLRCAMATYMPYFGTIVDQFVSELFGQELTVLPAADADNPNTPGDLPDEDFYREFAKDADQRKHPFVDLMKDALTTALVKRYAVVALDFPAPDGDEPTNKAEEDRKQSSRCYAYEVPVEQVLDWECDDFGSFEWVIVHKVESKRAGPRATRSTIHETWTIWSLGEGGGNATWERYGIVYPKDKPPKDEIIVPLEDKGETSFARIPLIRLELPHGLWVGNKIGPPSREHFSRRSALVGAENNSLCAIPYVARGPEISSPGSAMPSETQQDPDRGANPVGQFRKKGWVEVGSGDKLDFAEPRGHCYELVNKQLDELKDEIFRVTHQMAASVRPTPGALGRSGLSKQEDGKATVKVLRALGHAVRQFALEIYETISEARKEDVNWTPHGLDTYEIDNRQEVLEEAVALQMVDVPSETFKRLHAFQVAKKLVPGTDPDTLATIQDEINEGVSAQQEVDEIRLDVEKDQLLNPPEPTAPKAPGVKAPQGKPPSAPQVPGSKKPKAA